jgi:hypothetical protein
MDLQNIPDDLLMARGKYSTIRAAHEDELKRLSVLTGQLSAFGSQVLRWMQPEEGVPQDISGLLKDARHTIGQIEQCAATISELAAQKAELKPRAWPK